MTPQTYICTLFPASLRGLKISFFLDIVLCNIKVVVVVFEALLLESSPSSAAEDEALSDEAKFLCPVVLSGRTKRFESYIVEVGEVEVEVSALLISLLLVPFLLLLVAIVLV